MKIFRKLTAFALSLVIALMSFSICASAATTLEAPVITLSNFTSTGSIKVTWKAVEGAVSYKVYRADSEDGNYIQIQSTPRKEKIDYSAVAGNKYYYKVKAVAEDGTASRYSEIKSRTADLEQPVIYVSSIYTSGRNRVTWEKIRYATAYRVYRADNVDGPYKLMKTTEKTNYTNTNAEAGKIYYYKVKAICDNSAADSALSYPKSSMCRLPAPVITKASLNSSGKPRLKWEPVEGAVAYKVYRSEDGSDPFKLMKTTTNTTYTNLNFESGKTYYYKVKALYSDSAADSIYSKPIVSVTTK